MSIHHDISECACPSNQAFVLRRDDQIVVATLLILALIASFGGWGPTGGWQATWVEQDTLALQTARFEVDLNTAPAQELEQLPGIGATLVQRVMNSRAKEGAFLRPEDLMRVDGIGLKKMKQIRPYLRSGEKTPEEPSR
jgi:competence protein ComEA